MFLGAITLFLREGKVRVVQARLQPIERAREPLEWFARRQSESSASSHIVYGKELE